MKKPQPLYEGDTVLICAPASPPVKSSAFSEAVKIIEDLGFKARIAKHAKDRKGYLAGEDRHRADDLIRGLSDPKIKAVMCIRGGYGSARILPLLTKAKLDSKIFVGFSDITAIQAALFNTNFLGSIHSPIHSLTKHPNRKLFKNLISGENSFGLREFLSTKERSKIKALTKGSAKGRLLPANLTVLCSLLGTPYFPNLRGSILLLEDVNEAPYRIDRSLTQLLQSGSLNGVKGIGFGEFTHAEKQKSKYQNFEDIFTERLSSLKIPILVGLPFGHQGMKLPIPIGVRGELSSRSRDLFIIESTTK